MKDSVSEVIYQSSVFHLKNEQEYEYLASDNKVHFSGNLDLQEGDIISLPPTEKYRLGYVLRVVNVSKKNGKQKFL